MPPRNKKVGNLAKKILWQNWHDQNLMYHPSPQPPPLEGCGWDQDGIWTQMSQGWNMHAWWDNLGGFHLDDILHCWQLCHKPFGFLVYIWLKHGWGICPSCLWNIYLKVMWTINMGRVLLQNILCQWDSGRKIQYDKLIMWIYRVVFNFVFEIDRK